MEGRPPVLPYEDSADVDGLTVTRGEGYFRVVTPRPLWWRAIGKGWILGATYFLLIAILGAVAAFRPPGLPKRELAPQIGLNAALCTLFGTMALRQLRQHYIFELTPREFLIRRPGSFLNRPSAYRRELVRSTNQSAGDPRTLIVHITGHEMQELFISRDPAMVRNLSELLNEALNTPTPDIATPRPTVPSLRATPTKLGKAMVPVLLTVGLLVGIYVAVLGSLFTGLVVFGLIAAPIGIVYGTQKKEYWM